MQLGVDAGATRTKWSLARGTEVLARGDAPALTGHLFTSEQLRRARDGLRELLATVQAAAPHLVVERVMAGVTGLEQGDQAADTMTTLLAETFGLDRASVSVASDLELTYRAYHSPGQGVLLYAGTGSVAYHIDRCGRSIRAGGYGYLLADEGGALWLVRESLRHLLRERDEGRSVNSALAERLQRALGNLEWPAMRAFIYGQDRGKVAALAPHVTAAALEGDEAAQHVVAQGASELARLAQCVSAQLPDAPTITVTGGTITPALHDLVAGHLARSGLTSHHGGQRISDANATWWPSLSGMTKRQVP